MTIILFDFLMNRSNWSTAKKTLQTTTNAPYKNKNRRKKTKDSRASSYSGEDADFCEGMADGTFVRDPDDCASFYTCYMSGSSIKTTCGAGLMFDEACSCCNWPSQVITFPSF